MTLKRLKKELEKFNAELEQFYAETGERELPEVDTTILGEFVNVEPYKVKEYGYGLRVEADGFTWKVKEIRMDDETWLTDWETCDGLRWDLQENRKRLRKGWRVWRSGNPDAELEKEDEEE